MPAHPELQPLAQHPGYLAVKELQAPIRIVEITNDDVTGPADFSPEALEERRLRGYAAADAATVGTWDVEGGATNIMGRQGWTRATFKAGDHIKVVAHPMKDGTTKGASLFYAIMPDGKRLYHDIARPKGEGSVPASQP